MDVRRKPFVRGAWRVALATGSIAVAAATTSAQPFETAFGPGGSVEQAGRGATPVRLCPGGGFITAGSTGDTAIGMSRIYLARAGADGTSLWERIYDIAPGTFGETGESVVEVRDGSGFVIAGSSRTSASQRDAFLMKVDCDGKVRWTHAYSSNSGDEVALDVTEARSGNPTSATGAGDLVVAGFAILGGRQHGLLFRTDSQGRLVWNQRYETPGSNGFNAVIEARPTTIGTGDIVAAGYLATPGASDRGYVIRVSGETGLFAGYPHCGAAFASYGRVRFEAVVEQSAATAATPLVFIGTAAGTTTAHAQVFVASSRLSPCLGGAQRVIGGPVGVTTGRDVQTLSASLPIAPAGALAITGSTARTVTSPSDAFLLMLNPASLQPLTGTGRLFGNALRGSEAGHSLAVLRDGFLIAGRTTYDFAGAFDPGDLYVVKADGGGKTSCAAGWEPQHTVVPGSPVPMIPRPISDLSQTSRGATPAAVVSAVKACP